MDIERLQKVDSSTRRKPKDGCRFFTEAPKAGRARGLFGSLDHPSSSFWAFHGLGGRQGIDLDQVQGAKTFLAKLAETWASVKTLVAACRYRRTSLRRDW